MATYLLTYNPENSMWDDIDKLNIEERYIDSWNCSNTKRIKQGDRVFIIRLGVEPKGIIAAGIAYEGSYQDLHWDKEKKAQGKLSNYIDIDFDVLINSNKEPIFGMDKLLKIDKEFAWSSRSSGITIPDDIVKS